MLTEDGEAYFRRRRAATADPFATAGAEGVADEPINGSVFEPPPDADDHHDGDWTPGDQPDPGNSGLGHSGQVRMAYRLAASHHDRLLHVHGIGWHHWDGTRWTPDDTGAAKRAVLDVLQTALASALGDKQLQRDIRTCESNAGVTGVLGIAAALPEFAATVRDLDADPYQLNVSNGTIDLRTMELAPHNPADRITKVCRGAWRDDTRPGEWHTFIDTVLPDEPVRAFVQRLIGLSLFGRVVEHVLPIWTGIGANGKGTTVEALCWCLGDYAIAAEPDLLMHRDGAHPTGEMDLMGRRLVTMSETDDGRRLAQATMKRLTGGDTIRARRMRQDFVEFTPSHTAMLVTNHLPAVSGDDPAVWRRIRVVPFDIVIPDDEQDGELPERLEQAADEILTWAVRGWSEYQRIGLSEPDAVRARTDAYKATSDAIGRFIIERCHRSPAVMATTTQLWEAWQQWAKAEGIEPGGRGKFGEALDTRGHPAAPPSMGKRWRHGICVLTSEDGTDDG
jgi:putative DNA primase/helicase